MKKLKVELINLSVDDNFGLSGSGWVPPLGLISIGSYLKKLGYDVKIFDTSIEKETLIKELILKNCGNDTVLGFYTSILNYKKVIDFAKQAKDLGAKIVLGGPHASSLRMNVMKKRSFVDAVISGEGEVPFSLFLQRVPLEKIPNLTYRRNKEIFSNRNKNFDINKFDLDYSLINLGEYQKKFRNENSEKFIRPIAYYTQRGCSWGKCIFCAIPIKKSVRKTPQRVWEEIKMLDGLYKIDYIYETADSFTDDHNWLEELVRKRPPSINVLWEIFSRANIADEKVIINLKKLGVYKVYNGVETGNPENLKKMKKGHTLEEVINFARLLRKYNIKYIGSFMCGVIGETESSLKKTLDFATRLREISNSNEIYVFPMTPMPNSEAYKMLINKPKLKEKYVDEDCFDILELQKDWHENFCKVDFSEITAYIKEIKNVYKI